MSQSEFVGRADLRRPPALQGLNRVLGVAAGTMVAAMMVVVSLDVLGRYVFNHPLFGAFELTEVLMGLVIFAGMPLASARREHIAVTLIADHLPPRARAVQAGIMDLLCALAAAVMAWRIGLHGAHLFSVGETTLELRISRGAIAAIMAVLLALAVVHFLIHAWRDLIATRRGAA